MRKLAIGAALLLSTAGLITAFAGTASAFPTRTTPCVSCHSGANVPVTATQTANNGTTATYSLSAPSAGAIAVFNGSTKLATFSATTGSVTVPVGGTYTVYAVTGPTTSDGIGSTSVSPVAPAPTDTTAPVTTSNAAATYVSSAAITLSATDNAGGSGVARTYYRLDGAAQVTGTSVSTSALGSHTLVFWSVDVAGNAETSKSVTFVVSAPAPAPDVTAPVTTSNAVANYTSSALITLSRSDNAGGSGVAATYYRLDGATQVSGTSVSTSALGSHSLEFWSVDVAGNVETHKTVTFTVNAPVPAPDVTAPVTTSNATGSYATEATITLSASDNAGGSGVASTYYRLDGGAQTAGTQVSADATGTHTLEFWSVDVAGNAEVHKTVAFTIGAPAPAVDKHAVRLTIKSSAWRTFLRRSFVLSGYFTPGAGNESVALYMKRPGTNRWIGVSSVTTRITSDGRIAWSYRYKAKRRGTYQFQVRFAGSDTLLPSRSSVTAVRVR